MNSIFSKEIIMIFLIKCFYYSLVNEQKYLSSTKFLINGTDIITNESFNLQVNKEIKQIKSAISYDYNFLICISLNKNASCYINRHLENQFSRINCNYSEYNLEYKVLYFNQTYQFMFISRKKLLTTLLNNTDFSIQKCGQDIFFKHDEAYSIIYNTFYSHRSLFQN